MDYKVIFFFFWVDYFYCFHYRLAGVNIRTETVNPQQYEIEQNTPSLLNPTERSTYRVPNEDEKSSFKDQDSNWLTSNFYE